MSRNIIITEKQYKQLLINLLEEAFDIDAVGKDELSKCYVSYKDLVIFPKPCNELFLENWEPMCVTQTAESAIDKLKQKFGLHDWQIYPVKASNDVNIVICIANLADNIDDIKKAMEILGYHIGYEIPKEDAYGRKWLYMQFEPIYSGDCTEKIRTECQLLFHWTPTVNMEKIKQEGIVPKHNNKIFSYPNRVYLYTDKCSREDLVMSAYMFAKLKKKDSLDKKIPYTLLHIAVSRLPNDIHFFYDPNTLNAVYTEQIIPYSAIINEYNTKI